MAAEAVPGFGEGRVETPDFRREPGLRNRRGGGARRWGSEWARRTEVMQGR